MPFPPTADLSLKQAAQNFIGIAAASPTAVNLTLAIVNDLSSKETDYTNDLTAALDPSTRTKVTINKKNASKKLLVAALRAAARLVNAGPAVTDDQRVALGIDPRDREPTPAGPPNSFPLTTLEPLGGARNKMRLADSNTPTRRARPKHVIGAEVRFAVIDAGAPLPAPESAAWTRSMIVTKAISEVDNPEADAGKTLVCQSRWLGTKGQVGPWGPLESGTIAA